MKKLRAKIGEFFNSFIVVDSSIFGFIVCSYIVVQGLAGMISLSLDLSIMTTSIIIYSAGVAFSILAFIFLKKKLYYDRIPKIKNKNMKIGKIISIYSVDFTIEMLCLGIITLLNSTILKKIGISIINSESSVLDEVMDKNAIVGILVIAVLAPIGEEIIFRGIGLGILEMYDKKSAIIITSLLFGICHGNLLQSIGATIGGIVLGYVCLEYGLIYSILIHAINNLFVTATSLIDNETIVMIILIAVCYLGVCVIYFKFKEFKKILELTKFDKKVFMRELLSPLFILTLLVHMMLIVEEISFV